MTIAYPLQFSPYKKDIPRSFASYLSDLINAPVTILDMPPVGEWFDLASITRTTENCDLVLVIPPQLTFWQRLLWPNPISWLSAKIKGSILVLSQPRYPLRRLLFIVRNEKCDSQAADWALKLARPSNAVLTVLPIIPPPPNFLRISNATKFLESQLLAPQSRLGKTLQQLTQSFDRNNISWELDIQRGIPYQQIDQSLCRRNVDLIISGADSSDWPSRMLGGPIIPTLLRFKTQPILFAKS